MDRALNRIEAALDRIGSAARKARQSATTGQSPLPATDQALRAGVTAALADLDRLIATLEP